MREISDAMRAREYETVHAMEGSVHDEGGGEIRLTMRKMTRLLMDLARMAGEPPVPTRHPFIGANRAQRRAAEARARRRA